MKNPIIIVTQRKRPHTVKAVVNNEKYKNKDHTPTRDNEEYSRSEDEQRNGDKDHAADEDDTDEPEIQPETRDRKRDWPRELLRRRIMGAIPSKRKDRI